MADAVQPRDSSKGDRNELEERINETSEKQQRENDTFSHQATSEKAGPTFFCCRSHMRKIRTIYVPAFNQLTGKWELALIMERLETSICMDILIISAATYSVLYH